jgi:uncharacterized phage protein (TIGR01671 family)
MTREYLFRGKRTDNGEWVVGYFVGDMIIDGLAHDEGDDWYESGHGILVDPATVGQYTGLADKNGVKVFEGDVVARNLRNRNANYSAIGVVGFVDGRFDIIQCRGIGGRMNLHGDCVDVVGNIHDNPELLTPPPRTI